jgi:F-type H+-transporting ATPase subunit b
MATPTAHTETSGAPHKEQFPPFQSQTFPSQLLWLAITFVALYLIAAKLALPRVGAILEARRARIAGDLAEAQRLKTDSDAALAAYEQSLADARNRAQAVVNQRREKQNADAEVTRRAQEQSLQGKLAEADAAIAKTKSEAMTHVRDIAADAATTIVTRLIGTAPSGDAARSAVADVLKG